MNKTEDYNGCRYFKGESESPYTDQNKTMLWFYESVWIIEGKKYDTGEYIAYGLEDFMSDDGIPITLKALLFNRYAKGSFSLADAIIGFKDFYLKYYSN
ncbi:MAG: hypothetical protein LBK96_00450 [Prevotellaceae bacterium]|jgi:hypothetical protein|nr:hypothetical protein [Prevotellaceae bacterium]